MSGPNTPTSKSLPLTGLEIAPPQVLGGVRLVPLIRRSVRDDIRLSKRTYDEDCAIVSVDPKTDYVAYVPHGLVANWTTDGGAAFGTQVEGSRRKKSADGKVHRGIVTSRGLQKMVRRESRQQLRFLPLHVAMEGFLALHFGGPDIAWTEYSRRAFRDGMSPRSESVVPGRQIPFLEDALGVFEIHAQQVGMMVFVADALASVFVVPHPDDYVALHRTLVTDFYGELLWHYGQYADENTIAPSEIDPERISEVSDLRCELNRLRQGWASMHSGMATGLFQRPIDATTAYRFKPFTLNRFATDLDPSFENHLGESIYDDNGALQYLKTYRLSAAQCRRAYLLKQLAESDWEIQRLAERLGYRSSELILRFENVGFGYLIHQHVLDAARKQEVQRYR